jgi:hypothetical protein
MAKKRPLKASAASVAARALRAVPSAKRAEQSRINGQRGGRPRKDQSARVSVSYSSCTIYSTEPLTCFLCGAQVQPKVRHSCSRPEPKKERPS